MGRRNSAARTCDSKGNGRAGVQGAEPGEETDGPGSELRLRAGLGPHLQFLPQVNGSLGGVLKARSPTTGFRV